MAIINKISILLSLLSCLLISCKTKDYNQLDSDDFPDKKERIAVLNQEIRAESTIKDAAFELFNINGFQTNRNSIPGASYWDYKFAIQTDTNSIMSWKEGLISQTGKNLDLSWTSEIIKNNAQLWKTTCTPQYFTDENKNWIVVIYKQDGIVFCRIIQN